MKAKFPAIGTSKPGSSGSIVRISTSTVTADNEGRGVESGSTVKLQGSVGTSTGARYFKSVPTVAQVDISGTTLTSGTKDLYKFTVTADDKDDIALYKMSFNISTTSATTTNIQILEDETGKTVATSLQADSNGDVDGVVQSAQYGSAQVTIPAGETRTYIVRGTVTMASSGTRNLSIKMLGDSAYHANTSDLMSQASVVDSDTNDDFIWSPLSTTTDTTTDDWTNGYKVPGLPTTDLDTEVFTAS